MSKLLIRALDRLDNDQLAASIDLVVAAFADPERYDRERVAREMLSDHPVFYRQFFVAIKGGRIVGMSNREALGLGSVLNGRGVMELVVAGIAYQKGFIDPMIFSTLVLMGILTTFLTPILFKQTFRGPRLERYRAENR